MAVWVTAIAEIWDQLWKLGNPEILFTTWYRCFPSLSDFRVSWKIYLTLSQDNHSRSNFSCQDFAAICVLLQTLPLRGEPKFWKNLLWETTGRLTQTPFNLISFSVLMIGAKKLKIHLFWLPCYYKRWPYDTVQGRDISRRLLWCPIPSLISWYRHRFFLPPLSLLAWIVDMWTGAAAAIQGPWRRKSRELKEVDSDKTSTSEPPPTLDLLHEAKIIMIIVRVNSYVFKPLLFTTKSNLSLLSLINEKLLIFPGGHTIPRGLRLNVVLWWHDSVMVSA